MVETQKQRLCERRDAGLSVAWVPDLDAIPADSITGMFLSNELVDAFPVHRVVKRPLGLREIFVGWDGSRFVEIEAPPCSSALEAYFVRLGISLEAGQEAGIEGLLRPEGMGAAYKVLVERKGMLAPQLDGLRSRPYFKDALMRLPSPHDPLHSGEQRVPREGHGEGHNAQNPHPNPLPDRERENISVVP